MKITAALVVGAVALCLSACGSAETECRDGVKKMRAQMAELIGGHTELGDVVVQASTQVDMAQTALSTGNFQGCVDDLEQARTLLKSAQRNNQER